MTTRSRAAPRACPGLAGQRRRARAARARRDIAPEAGSLAESNAALERVVALAEELQAASGKRVLWGTAQLFMHPRYADGAATSAALIPRPWEPSPCRALWVQMQTSRSGAQAVAHAGWAAAECGGRCQAADARGGPRGRARRRADTPRSQRLPSRREQAARSRAGPSADVFAYAAAQVKAAMDATQRLGGSNYVFWRALASGPG
jgi:hypothetical protein